MERAVDPAIDHLQEVAWALFVIDLVFLLLGLLFVRDFGVALTFGVFGTLAASVTTVVGGIAVANVVWVRVHERWDRRRRGRPPADDR